MHRLTLLILGAVALTVFGVGLIAYTGLTGVRGAWGAMPLGTVRSPESGWMGYVAGSICVAAGAAVFTLIERRK